MLGLVDAVQPVASCAEVVAPVLNIPAFDGESEEALTLRYSRKSKPANQELVFEFTREPDLLHQYFRIYQSECMVVKTAHFLAVEAEYNRRSHVLVVRDGKLVIGGARITVNSPRINLPLPLEIGDFRLAKVFPFLEEKQMKYAEFSRLAVLPDYRGKDIIMQMVLGVYRKCMALGVTYMYAAAPLLNARAYKQVCIALGLAEANVHMKLDIPPAPGFEDIKDYLFSARREEILDSQLIAASRTKSGVFGGVYV